MTRKRKLLGLVIGFSATACVAMAAWFVIGLISGEVASKNGKKQTVALTAKVTMSPAEGLTPQGTPEAVTSEAANVEVPETALAYEVTGWKVKLTSENEALCKATEYSVISGSGQSGEGKGGEVITFKENTPIKVLAKKVTMVNEVANVTLSASAPEGCENVGWKLRVEAVHT